MFERFFGRQGGALIGALAAIVGTALALMLVPDEPATEGATMLSAAILSAAIVLVPAVRVIFGLQLALRPENFVAIGIVYWLLLDLIQGAYPLHGVSPDAISGAIAMVGLFAFTMWLGVLGKPWRLPNFIVAASERGLEPAGVRRLVLVCFVLGMMPYLIAVNFDVVRMFSYLGEDRWSAPWGRGQLGGWDAFLDQLQYFGYLLPCLAVFLGSRYGWLRFDSVVALCLAIVVLLFLSQGGGRRIVGVTVGAAIICWLLGQEKYKFRNLVGAALATGALLWGMQLMLEIRSQGYESFAQRGREYEYLHVDDNIYRLGQVIDIFPSELPYVFLKQIFFILVRPIPRIFWEGKPVDAGFDLPFILGQEGLSLSISIIGEWYLVYGWLAVAFGGWFHGKLALTVSELFKDNSRRLTNPIVYSVSVMVLVAGLRSMQDLVIMSYAVLAWYAVTWIILKKSLVMPKSS